MFFWKSGCQKRENGHFKNVQNAKGPPDFCEKSEKSDFAGRCSYFQIVNFHVVTITFFEKKSYFKKSI